MQSIGWRIPAAYKHVKDLSAAGFAWEYLRRNEDYRDDVTCLAQKAEPSVSEVDAFACRWGVRFPARPKRSARPEPAFLVAAL